MVDVDRRSPDLIVRTKLYRPPLGTDLLLRDRLIGLMDRAGEVPLILVSAPAGYGKSVFVSQWVQSRGGAAAWLSLDRGDGELRNFLAYLTAAVDSSSPGAGHGTNELLASTALPPLPVLADQLLLDLGTLTQATVIVLDDYHRIDASSPVHELMALVLERTPERARFVVTTREDPPLALESLRAGDRIHELRLQDLRFTGAETAEFLAASMQLTLSEETLAKLEREVEGWAVGLRLVALALRDASDPDTLLKRMRGGLPHAQEYLLQEVLDGLPSETRQGLLRSSILDRFSAGVLKAVSGPAPDGGPPASSARELLEELQRDNLFNIPLDGHGEWFRHHHLFQELLQRELRRVYHEDHIASLHARASAWFGAEGLIDEALHHALAAGDVDRAVLLVEENRHPILNADQWYVLEKWLALFPDAVVQRHAGLLMGRAWIFLHHFRFEAVFPILDAVEPLLAEDPAREALLGEAALCRGYILYFLGAGADCLEQIEKALESIPVSCYEARAQSEVIFALATQMQGRKEEAVRGLDDLLAHYDSPEDLRKTRLVVTQVFIHIISGDLAEAEAANRRLRDVAEGGGYAYAKAFHDYLQGLIHLYRYELDAAVEHLERSVSKRFIHFKRAAVDSITGLMLAQQARGQSDEARATLQLLRDYVATLDDPALWALVNSSDARLAMMRGQTEAAVRGLGSKPPPDPAAMIWWIEVPSVTRGRVLIEEGSPAGLEEAEGLLAAGAQMAEIHHNTYQLTEILPLLARACDKQGKSAEALGYLERAVALAQPGGIVFPFLEPGPSLAGLLGKLRRETGTGPFVERILSALGDLPDAASGHVPPTGGGWSRGLRAQRAAAGGGLEPPSDRELDVLELLADRLQDKEIADRLGISALTVKDHLKHIYQKLDVHNRRQAVRRAIKMGLLVPRPPSGHL